jgi:hypothetical protein
MHAGQKERKMKHAYASMVFAVAILAMAGCSHRAPTIAHVHIGHAMTGWYDTPDKEGLFVLAEKKAGESLKYAQAAVDGSRDLNRIKANIARANIHGEDLDGDGIVGSSANEYGMAQLRRDIERMIAREDPPYTTVNKWYLFNLIRLPDGSWIFRKRQSTASNDPYGGGGGGNGGGGY